MLFFTADWHIRQDYTIKGHTNIYGDIESSIEQICNYIKYYSPKAIFLLGDTFDMPYVSSKGLNLFFNFLDVCKTVNCKVFYILGQHDMSNPPLLSSISPVCQHLHQKYVEIDGYVIYGLDILSLTQQIEQTGDILVTHQVWQEFLPITGVMGMHNVPNFPLVISGDYHKPVELAFDTRMLISPGPIYPVRIYDTDPKSIVVLENGELDRLPIKTRPIHIIRIETEQDAERFISDFREGKYIHGMSDYPEKLRKPILILKYSPEVERLGDIRALVNDTCYLEVVFLSKTEQEAGADREETDFIGYGNIEDMIRALGANPTVTSLALAYWRDGNEPIEKYFYEGMIPR